ncbi:hypothetical protein EX30DRAFT_364150 [Ascodesmis nigricans]|uniref:Uncharacterized protein n=1 Tax=Ascodesmis nigricans TaxID=341454 RepID=A0A4V6RHF0_9PEZI|nr:hypothetical protein EX30DRAFT_364150 [Ascodesmis nigricans]
MEASDTNSNQQPTEINPEQSGDFPGLVLPTSTKPLPAGDNNAPERQQPGTYQPPSNWNNQRVRGRAKRMYVGKRIENYRGRAAGVAPGQQPNFQYTNVPPVPMAPVPPPNHWPSMVPFSHDQPGVGPYYHEIPAITYDPMIPLNQGPQMVPFGHQKSGVGDHQNEMPTPNPIPWPYQGQWNSEMCPNQPQTDWGIEHEKRRREAYRKLEVWKSMGYGSDEDEFEHYERGAPK